MSLTDSTTSHTVEVRGVAVTYFDSGLPGRGSVPSDQATRPLVLVHGTGGTTATHYGHLFPMMATRTRVVGIDWAPLPGAEALQLDDLVTQVLGAIEDALGTDAEFDLLGYSLGSVVATQLAAQLTGRVKNLVLVAGWMRTDAQQVLRNGVWRTLYESGQQDALARYTAFCGFSGEFIRSLPPAVLEGALAGLTSSGFSAQQMDLNARIDLPEELLAQITATTLVVCCTQDIMVPPHHQYELLGAIDDCRLTYMTSGHGFFMERPAELMQVVDLFLREPQRHPAGSIIPESHA